LDEQLAGPIAKEKRGAFLFVDDFNPSAVFASLTTLPDQDLPGNAGPPRDGCAQELSITEHLPLHLDGLPFTHIADHSCLVSAKLALGDSSRRKEVMVERNPATDEQYRHHNDWNESWEHSAPPWS
jgi:hypothetical protein